jgi:hypothetical protein
MVEAVRLTRSGCTFTLKKASVSHSGFSDGVQDRRASIWRRCVAARNFCASGLIVATRPNLAISIMFSLKIVGLQSTQYLSPVLIAIPQFLHRTGGRGDGSRLEEALPLASSRRRCVSLVAGGLSQLGLRIADHSICAIRSACVATARPHKEAVSERRAARELTIRQLPFLSSKNQSRRNCPFCIHSSKYRSICGRTGSIKSQARLSRAVKSA